MINPVFDIGVCLVVFAFVGVATFFVIKDMNKGVNCGKN